MEYNDNTFKRVALEKIQFYAQNRIPDYVRNNMNLETYEDVFSRDLVSVLTSHVLAFERGRKDHVESWSQEVETTETVVFHQHGWKPLGWLVLLLPIPFFVPGWVGGIIAGVIGIVIMGMCLTWEEETMIQVPPQTVRVEGEVIVPVKFYDSFPECTVRFPEGMGRRVELAVWDPPIVRVKNQEESDNG